MKKLFKKDIPANCEYCAIGKTLTSSRILCIKFGITSPRNHCKKFKYDPLKRVPKNQVENFNFNETDFKL